MTSTDNTNNYTANIEVITYEAMQKASELFETVADSQKEDEIQSIISTIARLQVLECAIITTLPFGLEKNREFYRGVCDHVILSQAGLGALNRQEVSTLYPHIPLATIDAVLKTASDERSRRDLSEAAVILKKSLEEVERNRNS